MVNHYFELPAFVDSADDDLVDLLPSATANWRTLLVNLKVVESAFKALQGGAVSLLDARVWFDSLVKANPSFFSYVTISVFRLKSHS